MICIFIIKKKKNNKLSAFVLKSEKYNKARTTSDSAVIQLLFISYIHFDWFSHSLLSMLVSGSL